MIHGRHVLFLFAAALMLCALISAGPTIVALTHALAPLVLSTALAAAVLRLVWHYTNRDR